MENPLEEKINKPQPLSSLLSFSKSIAHEKRSDQEKLWRVWLENIRTHYRTSAWLLYKIYKTHPLPPSVQKEIKEAFCDRLEEELEKRAHPYDLLSLFFLFPFLETRQKELWYEGIKRFQKQKELLPQSGWLITSILREVGVKDLKERSAIENRLEELALDLFEREIVDQEQEEVLKWLREKILHPALTPITQKHLLTRILEKLPYTSSLVHAIKEDLATLALSKK